MKPESEMQNTFGFVFVLLGVFAALIPVQSQNQEGFVSLDCGLVPNDFTYTEKTTNITYISDMNFIDTGESKRVRPDLQATFQQQMWSLRSFPDGTRNCYNFNLTKGDKYLIRASFLYGNYDDQNVSPSFDLYVGPTLWTSVDILSVNISVSFELVHVLPSDHLQICLAKTGIATPFISALELRPLKNDTYNTQRGSLMKDSRLYFSTDKYTIRFEDDVHDRTWRPFSAPDWTMITTNLTINPGNDSYDVPQAVLRSAATPKNASESMSLIWTDKDPNSEYYIFLHFAEIEILKANESREFNITANGGPPFGPYSPPNFTADSLRTVTGLTSTNGSYDVTLQRTARSTHPPLINALEVYKVIEFSQLETDQNDADAIKIIEQTYRLNRVNWKGDPCVPRKYMWDGLNCTYNDFETPRITSLNLSSSRLKGQITPYIFNLSRLTSLDLSNNNLTGEVPEFLANMKYLSFLNLSVNRFNSSIPPALIGRENNGLILIADRCQQESCRPKHGKRSIIVPVVASVASLAVVLAGLGIFLMLRRKSQRDKGAPQPTTATHADTGTDRLSEPSIFTTERRFTYAEVVRMTNTFDRVLGKGGFGVVYHGCLNDREQVAVKMLSQSSAQGYKQFRTEVELLLRVHHRNLVSLVGYCDEGDKLGLIYEYMANGDLKEHLSGQRGSNVLSWAARLGIATETAQGLEYLHKGSKPPMIHRDVKANNILLNEHFQAKLADFGLSRTFPVGGETHVSTVVAGTPGYLDPEYYKTNWLTEKSDIYSFGIVLLEIITNQPVINNSRERPHIAEWVKLMVNSGDIRNIVDPKLREDFDVNTVWKAVELAISCVNKSSSKRPSISHIVMELSECLAAENARAQGSRDMDSFESPEVGMSFVSGHNPRAR